MLEQYPIENWNGGKIRRISDSIFQLLNGQVFTIHGKTFFTMGGACSIDRHRRTQGKSWWPQEIPSYAEMDEGIRNLQAHDNEVDYIITHTLPDEVLAQKFRLLPQYDNSLNSYLTHIWKNVAFSQWDAGHMHDDCQIGRFFIHYLQVVEVETFQS